MALRSAAALAALLAFSQPALAAPAMWEASDGDSKIVLFGSVHMLPPELEWRTDLIDEAVANAPFVYFETDIGPRGIAALTMKMLGATLALAANPWTQSLTPEQTEKLAAALDGTGMTLESVGVLPPWIVAVQLSMGDMFQPGGTAPVEGVDSVLQWELPLERKGYLETPGEQFDLLNTGTIEEQIEGLFIVLDADRPDASMFDDLVDAWVRGDTDEVIDSMLQEPGAEEMLDVILYQRNRNWIPEIERMLADNEENLVVVGAAHLAGENSVLDLLEEAGYTVTRIQ